MAELETTQRAPLSRAEDGTIRVADLRVTLDTVVSQFKQGATAEQIQEDFPSISLGDVYAVIAYYLQHTPAVEEYLRTQKEASAQTRQEIEGQQDSSGLRERLRQRRSNVAKS